jgi:hypothetical protein
MDIAPGVSANTWWGLKLGPDNRADWRKARSILRARINERYIVPCDRLINAEVRKAPGKRRYGFAVMALDCLLIETMGAFLDGLTDTTGHSRRVFCKFLRATAPFANAFAKPRLAEKFYDQFRCGILHQAEVKGEGRVWSIGPIVDVDGERITVNRNAFHAALKAAFSNYLSELSDPANASLRENFKRKMDFIARTPPAARP